MASPYELLTGLALLREQQRLSQQAITHEFREWSGFWVQAGSLSCLIPCEQVDEVITPQSVAKVRGVSPWVLGVAYFRAQLLSIVDVAGLLLGENTPQDRGRILAVRGQHEWFGLRVNLLEGVRHIWSDTPQIEAPPHINGFWLRYVREWLLLEEQQVAVLDANQLVAEIEVGKLNHRLALPTRQADATARMAEVRA